MLCHHFHYELLALISSYTYTITPTSTVLSANSPNIDAVSATNKFNVEGELSGNVSQDGAATTTTTITTGEAAAATATSAATTKISRENNNSNSNSNINALAKSTATTTTTGTALSAMESTTTTTRRTTTAKKKQKYSQQDSPAIISTVATITANAMDSRHQVEEYVRRTNSNEMEFDTAMTLANMEIFAKDTTTDAGNNDLLLDHRPKTPFNSYAHAEFGSPATRGGGADAFSAIDFDTMGDNNEQYADDAKITAEADAAQEQLFGVSTEHTHLQNTFDEDVDASTDLAEVSPMRPSKNFSDMMRKISFTIFTPLSDLGCFSWQPKGKYIPIDQIRSEGTIQRYMNLSGQPARLSSPINRIPLNIRFGTFSNQSNRFFNKFPYGENEIASLHVATQVSCFESTSICFLWQS